MFFRDNFVVTKKRKVMKYTDVTTERDNTSVIDAAIILGLKLFRFKFEILCGDRKIL